MFGRGRHGFEGPRERLFEKGDLKYVVLDLLSERPRHGYDIIQALEERFRGLYTPSPGSVYPILQMLEDLGQVVPEARDGRKVYSLTESGRAFLAEHARTVEEIWSRAERGSGPGPGDWHAAMHEMRFDFKELADLFARRARHHGMTSDKLRRVHEVILRARTEIEAILRE